MIFRMHLACNVGESSLKLHSLPVLASFISYHPLSAAIITIGTIGIRKSCQSQHTHTHTHTRLLPGNHVRLNHFGFINFFFLCNSFPFPSSYYFYHHGHRTCFIATHTIHARWTEYSIQQTKRYITCILLLV